MEQNRHPLSADAMAMVIGSILLWAAISDSASGQTDSAEVTGGDSTYVYETT